MQTCACVGRPGLASSRQQHSNTRIQWLGRPAMFGVARFSCVTGHCFVLLDWPLSTPHPDPCPLFCVLASSATPTCECPRYHSVARILCRVAEGSCVEFLSSIETGLGKVRGHANQHGLAPLSLPIVIGYRVEAGTLKLDSVRTSFQGRQVVVAQPEVGAPLLEQFRLAMGQHGWGKHGHSLGIVTAAGRLGTTRGVYWLKAADQLARFPDWSDVGFLKSRNDTSLKFWRPVIQKGLTAAVPAPLLAPWHGSDVVILAYYPKGMRMTSCALNALNIIKARYAYNNVKAVVLLLSTATELSQLTNTISKAALVLPMCSRQGYDPTLNWSNDTYIFPPTAAWKSRDSFSQMFSLGPTDIRTSLFVMEVSSSSTYRYAAATASWRFCPLEVVRWYAQQSRVGPSSSPFIRVLLLGKRVGVLAGGALT